jgi:hypothetical protein
MSSTKNLLRQLETRRKSKVIVLVYGDEAFMTPEDVDVVYEMIDEMCKGKKVEKIDMILSSLGGDGGTAYGIAKLVRRYCDEFNVLIPRKAKSAATLLALGADKILMSKIAELGPIDPVVTHPLTSAMIIPARCAPYFVEKILPKIARMEVQDYFLKVDYAHVGYCMMTVEKARDYAKKLLKTYHFKGQPDKIKKIGKIVERLTGYPSHDFTIDFDEVRDIGLNVEELSDDDWELIYPLHREYEEELDEVVFITETVVGKRQVKRPKLVLW